MPEVCAHSLHDAVYRDASSVFVSSTKKSAEPWKLCVSDINGRAGETGEIAEWITDCVLRNRIAQIRDLKCSFSLVPYDVGPPTMSDDDLSRV